MASALRPTPETGRVAATKMPASAIGPSWSQRAGREARLAFRQAQRSGDREQAMRIALGAEEAGLSAQASIGSAERRLASQYQGRGADTAITAEVASALTPPAAASGQPRLADEFVEQAQTPAATPVPGATEPPENPVSGSRVPATGDAESGLGGRRINPLTGKPLGFDPRNPSPVDTMSRIRELTAAGGENLTRGAAVRKVNDERRAAGQAPVDYEDTLDELQAADRETESSRRRGAAMNRGPTLSVDPDLARSFRSGGTERRATPPESPAASAPAASLVAKTPGSTAFRIGQGLQNLTPAAVRRRASAAVRRRASAAAVGAVSGAVQAAVEPVREARDLVAREAYKRAVAASRFGERRRQNLRDLARGFFTPPQG